jgi:acyl-CoA thioesterase FadM
MSESGGTVPAGFAAPVPSRGDPAALRDALPYRIVRPYRVRFEEATASETVRTAVYLAWLADIAWQHSTALGFGRDWYAAKGLFWLVRGIRLDVLRPIPTYASVLVATQVMGYRRVAARRHGEVRDPEGRLLAAAQIDWVMTNERGVPTRVPPDFNTFVAGEPEPFEMHKVPLPEAPADAVARSFHVRRRDLDPLDHVNNSVYVDYLEEALQQAGQSDLLAHTPRRYVLDFAASAEFGNVLTGTTWPHGDGWAYRLTRENGERCVEMFRATVAPLGDVAGF